MMIENKDIPHGWQKEAKKKMVPKWISSFDYFSLKSCLVDCFKQAVLIDQLIFVQILACLKAEFAFLFFIFVSKIQ